MFAMTGPDTTMRADGKQTVDSLTDGSRGGSATGHAPDPFDRVLALIIEGPQRRAAMFLPGAKAASHNPAMRNLRRPGKAFGGTRPAQPAALGGGDRGSGLGLVDQPSLAGCRSDDDARYRGIRRWAPCTGARAIRRPRRSLARLGRSLEQARHPRLCRGTRSRCLPRHRPHAGARAAPFSARLRVSARSACVAPAPGRRRSRFVPRSRFNPHLHGIRALLDEISGGAARMH